MSIFDFRQPLVSHPASAKPVEKRTLRFKMQHQAEDEWCWAAVSTSVSLFYNHKSTWTQCKVVCLELGQQSCCQDGSTPQCNQPWRLDLALTRVGCLDSVIGNDLPFADVVQAIDSRRPVGVRIGWNGGGGHFVIIDGYVVAGQIVDVQDSWYGHSTVAYATFCTAYQGTGTWTDSYRTR